MKVLHVESGRHLYGGAQQVVYLLDGLAQRGIDCVLVCERHSAIADHMRNRVRRLYAIPMRGDLDLALVWRLWRIIRQEGPDLVHLHSRRGADVLGALAARWAGVRCVLSRRVDNAEPRWLVRWKYRLYARVISISEGIYRVLREEGVAASKLVCVRSAVGPEAYARDCDMRYFRRRFALPQASPVLAVVAQLIPRKGHRFLLQALPRLVDDFPGLRLLLFGRGPLLQTLHRQVRELGLEEAVIFAGFRTDLPKLLPCVDLLVHPALREGLGIALLQAAGAGVPIVAVRAGGMPEVVRHGLNGLLVPPADSAALGEAIGRLLADVPLRRRMGEAGSAMIQREFSIEQMVAGNLRVYHELLA